MTPNRSIMARLCALIARTESPFEEEARTSALLAVQLMRKCNMLPERLVALLAKASAKPRKRGARTTDAQRGARGGHARAKVLSAEERSGIARKAALARWRVSGGKSLPKGR